MGVGSSQIACIIAGEQFQWIGEIAPAGPKASWEKIDPNAFGPFNQLGVEFGILVAQEPRNFVDIVSTS